jgi:hypothetical protein
MLARSVGERSHDPRSATYFFADWRPFAAAAFVGFGPPMAGAYDVRSAPLFAMLVFGWGIAPVAVAVIMFMIRRWYVAWGWLVAVLAYSYFALAAFFRTSSSTAIVDFLWAPVWGIVIAGPIGALLGFSWSRYFGKK